MNIFALLGLIEKIQVEQIPQSERTLNLRASVDLKNEMIKDTIEPLQELLKQAKTEEQKDKITKRIEQIKKYWKSVCYYYVPPYTKETFIKANEIAKIMVANHFTQGKFDRFWVEKVFGIDKAKAIFTEYLGRTKLLNEREELLEKTIVECVNKYKCVTRQQIIDNVPLAELKIHTIKPWSQNEIQYKKDVAQQIFRDVIEAVKDKYGLEYKRLNAEEKQKYNKHTSKWYVFKKE